MTAFLPLMLLPGILGKFMFIIPLVVTTALALSLVEAYWMLPSHAMAWGLPKPRVRWRMRSVAGLIALPLRTLIWLVKLPVHLGDRLDVLAGPVRQRCQRRLRRSYTRRLIQVLRHPWRTMISLLAVMVLLMTVATSAETIARYLPASIGDKVANIGIKVDFFASEPVRLYYVNVQMPVGTPLAETLQTVTAIEGKVRRHIKPGEVRQMISYSGLLFTETAPFFGDHFGQVVVALNPKTAALRSVEEMVHSMRDAVVSTPGPVAVTFLTLAGGPPTTKPVSIKVLGNSAADITPAADALKQALAAIDGVSDISDDNTSGQRTLTLTIDTAAAQRAGINPAQLSRTLQLLVKGEVVASLRDQGETIDVRVRAGRRTLLAHRFNFSAFAFSKNSFRAVISAFAKTLSAS